MIVKAHKCIGCKKLAEADPGYRLPYAWFKVTTYVEGRGTAFGVYCSLKCATAADLPCPE